jgi:branched-chain amino acid transport system substrate-binding protein
MLKTIIKSICIFCLLLGLTGNSWSQAPIKIGGLFAVTGAPSFLGEPERNTANMVVDQINAAGGIKGRMLKLVYYDTQGDATKAVQAATRLIKEDRVSAIIGPSTTGETMAVIPVVENAGIPLISCAAGIKITEPVKRWVFKTAQNDSLAVERIYDHLKKRNINNVAIITVSDGFGASGREQLKLRAKASGITIVSDEIYGPNDTDMAAQLVKMRGSKAQAIICWGTNPGPAKVARNARQLGLNLPLYMSHGVSSMKFIELAGDAAEGIILPSGRVIVASVLPKADQQKKPLLSYVNDYKKHFKVEGDHFGGHAWDAVMLLKGAIESGDGSPASIRNEIENTRNFKGIGGIFNFAPQDHAGLTKDAFVLVTIRNKEWVLVK